MLDPIAQAMRDHPGLTPEEAEQMASDLGFQASSGRRVCQGAAGTRVKSMFDSNGREMPGFVALAPSIENARLGVDIDFSLQKDPNAARVVLGHPAGEYDSGNETRPADHSQLTQSNCSGFPDSGSPAVPWSSCTAKRMVGSRRLTRA